MKEFAEINMGDFDKLCWWMEIVCRNVFMHETDSDILPPIKECFMKVYLDECGDPTLQKITRNRNLRMMCAVIGALAKLESSNVSVFTVLHILTQKEVTIDEMILCEAQLLEKCCYRLPIPQPK